MTAATPHTVWLVEDHETYRRTVQRVLERIDGLNCPHAFGRCEDALAAMDREPPPEVILLDVGLPGMDGIAGLPKLKAAAPNTHVIVLTVFDDQDKILRAICAGASGYLLKTSSQEDIAEAIRQVLRGGAPMTASIAHQVLGMFKSLARPPGEYGLTPREKQILELMVEGLLKKEIASRLNLSTHTVDTHLRRIYDKLQVHTRTGAVSKALRERLC
ncbi:MAG: response regulator transcription factor [Verrucomicrobia bacterium]|nr:response regulator transcription factor [Verrucomicrobiota bacterium]